MNGLILAIPIVFVRYVLLRFISKEGLRRAAYFPPLTGFEKRAFFIYQITINGMLIYMIFLKVKVNTNIYTYGLVIYLIGFILYMLSTINFAKPKSDGINIKGLYRFSRNPMYVSFFLYFLGCCMLTKSLGLLVLLIIFQVSSHFIILSEERWCKKEFGKEYIKYMKRVRRYI